MHVSETGSYVAMEKEGLRHCLDKLLDKLLDQGVDIISLATDRHTYWCNLPHEKILPPY